jgi:hypothetical protein
MDASKQLKRMKHSVLRDAMYVALLSVDLESDESLRAFALSLSRCVKVGSKSEASGVRPGNGSLPSTSLTTASGIKIRKRDLGYLTS